MLNKSTQQPAVSDQPELTRESAMAAVGHVLCGPESFMGCEAENITASASLRDDLGLDSLDFVELAINLEESLGIEEIDDSDIDDAATVADVAKMLTRKKVIDPARFKLTLEAMEKAKGAEATLAKKVAADRVKADAAKKEKAETPSVMAGVHAKAKAAGA
ncbi:MAG: acyl carrier protein [Terriglobales bacterium]